MHSKEQLISRITSSLELGAGSVKDVMHSYEKTFVILDANLIQPHRQEQISQACINLLHTLGIEPEKVKVIFNQDNSAPSSHSQEKVAEKMKVTDVKKILIIASGKGGVGKSTFAAILAMMLAKHGLKVGLLDADIYGPSIPTLFNINERPKVDGGGVIQPIQAFGVNLMSMGFLLAEAQAVIWRGPMLSKALTQMMHGVDWKMQQQPLDILIVDSPPGTGDIHLSLLSKYQVNGAIFVSTSQALALQDTIRSIDMFKKMETPIWGMVQNMSYIKSFIGKKYIFGKNDVASYCKAVNIKLIADIPLSQSIAESRCLEDHLWQAREVLNGIKIFDIIEMIKK